MTTLESIRAEIDEMSRLLAWTLAFVELADTVPLDGLTVDQQEAWDQLVLSAERYREWWG